MGYEISVAWPLHRLGKRRRRIQSFIWIFPKTTFRWQAYWYRSGGDPEALLSAIWGTPQQRALTFFNPITVSSQILHSAHVGLNIHPERLLLETGYLTLQAPSSEGLAHLKFPNQAVKNVLARQCANEFTRSTNVSPLNFFNELVAGDNEQVVESLNQVLSCLASKLDAWWTFPQCLSAPKLLWTALSEKPQIVMHFDEDSPTGMIRCGNQAWLLAFEETTPRVNAHQALDVALTRLTVQKEKLDHQENASLALVGLAMVWEKQSKSFTVWKSVDLARRNTMHSACLPSA